MVEISCAGSAADSDHIKLISIAIALSFWNVVASALKDVPHSIANTAGVILADASIHIIANAVLVEISCAGSAADSDRIKLISIAIALSFWNVVASALKDVPHSIANTAGVILADASIHIIANAVLVGVFRTRAATIAHYVNLICVAITISCWNVRAAAVINGTWAIANTTRIQISNTRVHVITDVVVVDVVFTITSAVSYCVLIFT